MKLIAGNQSYDFSQEPPIEVVDFYKSEVNDKFFPVGFIVRSGTHDIFIDTAWGLKYDFTLNSSYPESNPFIFWVEADSVLEFGSNTSLYIFINNSLHHSIEVPWNNWGSFTSKPYPILIEFSYEWFSYFVGETKLTATFYSTGQVFITHTIIRNTRPESLPYTFSFEFNSSLFIDDWNHLASYIENNGASGWQYWLYCPLECAFDNGGYRTSVFIEWEDFTKNILEMVDDDSGLGIRYYTPPHVATFLTMLMNKTTSLIDQYLNESLFFSSFSSSTSSFSSANSLDLDNQLLSRLFIFAVILILLIVIFQTKRGFR